MSFKIVRYARQSAIAAAALLSMGLTPSFAWDGQVVGKIAVMEAVADGQNYGFRIYLTGGLTMCAGGANWAAINTSASNYQATVSLLELAYSLGKTVTVYTNKDASNNCLIGYVSMQ